MVSANLRLELLMASVKTVMLLSNALYVFFVAPAALLPEKLAENMVSHRQVGTHLLEHQR